EDFDRDEAEELRRKMASNDFSWAPAVQLVSPEVLHGNSGAYAASTRTVYLNHDIPGKFERAFVYLEELGHHLDTLLKTTDSAGDEGALFRIFMTGEQVSADELALIRQEDDHGSITINGKDIEVEFLSCWVICSIGSAVWNGIKGGAGWVWKGA